MSYVRRVAVLASAAVAGALLTVAPAAAAPPAPPAAPSAARPPAAPPDVPDRKPAEPGPPEWVGTYQLVARDVVRPDGSLRDVYDHRLVVGGKSYRLRMPKGTRLTGGTPVRVRGRLVGQDLTADEVTAVGAPARVPTTGTTKVLVILAYWSEQDSMTVTKARNQVFSDDHGWYDEASYGQLGLTGDVTGWHKITAPTAGRCYEEHLQLMSRAKARALNAGYDAASYGRTILYFPQCSGDAAGVAGWAYQPGTTVWLNGYFDRRVSTHEQGHNYGLPHAHTLHCESGGVRTTITGACGFTEYGDDYDAMGASEYAAHFSAPQKDSLGWLGTTRKKVVGTTAQTFTLPPFERAVTPPVAAVTTASSTRKYWVEYRQPVGYDNALPPGATNGVLVRAVDTTAVPGATGPLLLDVSPQTGWDDAVIPPGGAWTSPEGIRISVGTVTASGATVTIAGGAQPPTPPSAPLDVTATGGDGTVRLTWDPPASNGGATVESYVVVRTPGNVSTTVTERSTTVAGLANGTEYAFTVAARNAAGTGVPSAAVAATPTVLLPSVVVTAPADGVRLAGPTTFSATATPHPDSGAAIDYVAFSVDGEEVDWDSEAPYSTEYDPTNLDDGTHVVTATAYDANWRFKESAPVTFTVTVPRPTISITQPSAGAVLTGNLVELAATSAPAAGSGAAIQWVTYELADGTVLGYGSYEEPHVTHWDTTGLDGDHVLVAKAYDENGRVGVSAPVPVTIDHPAPSVVLTAPAEAATASGVVTLAADATSNADSLAPVAYVDFRVGVSSVGIDYEAPYSVDWDSSAYTGEQVVTAYAVDEAGFSATSPGRTVFLSNPLPSVTLTSPAPGATVEGLATFTAVPQAHPEGAPIARVEFTVDGWTPGGAVEAPGPYTVTWDPGTYYGAHTVVATVYDTAGRSAQSAAVAFTVPEPLPGASVTAPANGATVRSGPTTFTATATPGRTGSPIFGVEFVVGDLSVGWDSDGADGWSAQWELTPGEHTLLARAHDADGFRGTSAPVTVTVVDPPDAPAGVSATAGADGTATVSWTAPGYDGGLPVLDYVVRVSDGTERVASGSPAGVSGLANGTTYTFQVKARTAIGFGPLSAASAGVTPGTRVAIAIAVNTTKVSYGRSVTVTGTLTAGTAPVAGKTLRLLACTPGSATGCADTGKTAVTSSTGKVSIAYAPKLHRDLRLRYVANGDRYLAATSAAKKVSVAAVVSSAISRTSIVLGRTVTVSGRVAPAHGGKRVYLQRLTGTGWKSVTYKTQTSTGYAAFTVKPTAKGTWRYRLYFPADADHLAGYSPSRSVTVTAT